MKNKKLIIFSFIFSVFSTNIFATNSEEDLPFSDHQSVSSLWRMPEVPLFNPEQHAQVEAAIRSVGFSEADVVFTLIKNHIISEEQGDGFEHGAYVSKRIQDFVTRTLLGKEETVLGHFFRIVALHDKGLESYDPGAGFRSNPMHTGLLNSLMNGIELFTDPQEQEDAVNLVASLFTSVDHFDVTSILKAFTTFSPSERGEVLEHARAMIAFMSPEDFMKCFRGVSIELIRDVCASVSAINREYDNCLNLASGRYINNSSLFKALISLSSSRRATLIDDLRPFMQFPGMTQNNDEVARNNRELVEALASLPDQDFNVLLEQVKDLRAKLNSIIDTEGFESCFGFADVVKSLGSIPESKRSQVVDDVTIIAQGTKIEGLTSKFGRRKGAVNKIISGIVSVVDKCLQYNPQHYKEYLEDMLGMTNNQQLITRTEILHRMMYFFEHNDDLELGQKVRRLSQLLPYFLFDQADSFETKQAMDLVIDIHINYGDFGPLIPFFDLPISMEHRIELAKALIFATGNHQRFEGDFIFVLPEDRDELLEQALKLFRLKIVEPDYKKILIHLAALDMDDRRQKVQALVDAQKDNYKTDDIITCFGHFHGLERIYIGARMAPDAQDVHEGNRDQKVTDALKEMVEHQGHVSNASLNKSVSSLKSYIASGDFTDSQKRRAVHALEGEVSYGWGNLISQIASNAFANLDGPGLVGRLWIFADTYLDTEVVDDAENARKSFVLALADSADEDGFMVCNLGKIQRIVCGVLQGRLKGVVVDDQADDIIERPEVEDVLNDEEGEKRDNSLTPHQLSNLFLGRYQTQTLPNTEAALCAAAAAWLREQPDVKLDEVQSEFMVDVKAFYKAMK